MMATDPILCLPASIDPSLLLGLSQAGYRLAVQDQAESSEDRILAALISARGGLEAAKALCAAVRNSSDDQIPVLLLVSQSEVSSLDHTSGLFDDFAILPSSAAELLVRFARLTAGRTGSDTDTVVAFGPLKINTETYQAMIDGRVLDLTYMEYELLAFLATNATKVFTREALLSRVWGYEYYGGARTVDVHIRRLRAKLGEEHASLIETIRSVGYRLGQPSWANTTIN